MGRELSSAQLIERSIQKKYRKELWTPFILAIKRYQLIEEGDKIAVCISGGKDSMLMAKLMQILQKFSDFPFDLEFLVMDPGYAPANRRKIEENAEKLQIPIHIFETDIFQVANGTEKNPCYLCARMRRGHLYNQAKLLNCNKIALGHHLNDVIETVLVSMMYASKIDAIIPKAHSEHFAGMELIRPMYCIREEAIERWCAGNDLHFIQCACRFTEENELPDREHASKRKEVKQLIRQLRQTNPEIEGNLFRSVHAVQLDTFPGYKLNGRMHSFLETYDTIEETEQTSSQPQSEK